MTYKDESYTERICSICFKLFTEFGNNAEPINEGRCCDSCNALVVVARINQMKHVT